MQKTVFIKWPALFITFLFSFIELKLSAQVENSENIQPKFKQVMVHIPKIKTAHQPQQNDFHVIDSLKTVIHNYDSLLQKMHFQFETNDNVLNELKQKIDREQAVHSDLKLRVSEYETFNLQTRKNNLILMIYNSAVCVLLFGLFINHLVNSRKSKSAVIKLTSNVSKEISEKNSPSKQNNIVHNLQLLERLGKLRDIGALTEEEFILQKRVILKKLN